MCFSLGDCAGDIYSLQFQVLCPCLLIYFTTIYTRAYISLCTLYFWPTFGQKGYDMVLFFGNVKIFGFSYLDTRETLLLIGLAGPPI